MSVRIDGRAPNYEVQMYELKEEFKDQPDAKLIENAKAAVKAGRCAEAGTLIKNIKDAELKDEMFDEISALIEATFGSSSPKAYEGLHQFLDNYL